MVKIFDNEAPTSPIEPIERKENESALDFMQRLYNAVLPPGQFNSIDEAMRHDSVNFARLINNIPKLIAEAQKKI